MAPWESLRCQALAKGTEAVAKALADATKAGALTVVGGEILQLPWHSFITRIRFPMYQQAGGASLEFF